MKKILLVALFALLGLSFVDADARYYRNGGCGSCPAKSCASDCEVIEEPCGLPPCCLTAVEVPARKIKHVSYSWVCPTGCRRTDMESSFDFPRSAE